MRSLALTSLSVAIVAALAACGTPPSAILDRAGAARLDALRQAPETAGDRIYQGAVFPIEPPGAPQVFSYERRIDKLGDGLASSHITRDTNGDVVVVESAQFSPAYEVTRFEAVHKEAGYSGSVIVTGGRHLEYVLSQGGKIRTATEDVADPVVTGPSLHGFILHHWDALAAGQRLPVRMIVLAKMQTYGFEIQRADASDGRTAFSITPTNFLVRLALDPLRVEFDSSTRNVLRYIGRVPPMQGVAGRSEALDARVEYTMNVPVYR
ncbi:MAG TPA: hypothetical protein VFR86_28680 [Burkholderiaceae bacterium]|nr:hypothetical protein [Burkholderiaceae bacterium]